MANQPDEQNKHRKQPAPEQTEPETYDLNIDEDELAAPAPAKPSLDKLANDPRLAMGDDPAPAADAPAPPPASASADAAGHPADRPIPKLWKSEPEPTYVDPAVASRRREEARIRAAEQLAIADARKRKRHRIIMAVLVGIALVLGVIFLIQRMF